MTSSASSTLRQVLAELGEDRADALRLLRRRGGHRVFEPLARHERRHRAADERRLRRALAQPRVGRHREQNLAGQARRRDGRRGGAADAGHRHDLHQARRKPRRSVEEAEEVTQHYLDVLDKVQAAGLRAQISVKPTQLGLDLDKELCFRNLQRLVDRAAERGNFVWIDMESSPYVDPTLDLFRRTRARSPRDRHRAAGVPVSHRAGRRVAAAARLRDPDGQGRVSRAAGIAYPKKADVDQNFYALVVPAAERGGAARRRAAAHRDPRSAAGRSAEGVHRRAAGAEVRLRIRDAVRHPAAAAARLVQAGRPLRVLIAYGEYWFPWYMRRLAERPPTLVRRRKNTFGG